MLGYLFWTISDNWEWADGYGPKFGLVAVDRANGFARMPRPSYHLFTKVGSMLAILIIPFYLHSTPSSLPPLSFSTLFSFFTFK